MKLEELEARIAALEKQNKTLKDIEEIKQVQQYYVDHLFPPEWDKIKDCFSKDAIFDTYAGRVRGHEAVHKILVDNVARIHTGHGTCFVLHPIISVDGDKATATWAIIFLWTQPQKLAPLPFLPSDYTPDWVSGPYDLEYVREDGKWKISYLKWRATKFSPYYEKILE
jgi:hypothetical protein